MNDPTLVGILLACIRYHKQMASFERKLAPQMFVKKWKDKATYLARKHERFAAAIQKTLDGSKTKMGTEADYLIDQQFDREHGEYGDKGDKMSDKKGSENCKHPDMGNRSEIQRGYACFNCHKADHWLRNPSTWLDIPPTEPGAYFYRKCKCSHWKVGEIVVSDRGLVWKANNKRVMFSGQFQGPITPKEDER